MQLSIIIVNYNVRAFLENALVSIRKAMQGIDGEIVVVDNASDDGSAEMVRGKFPEVRLIVNDRNIGFAAANNRGLESCSGAYLLLLNPDTILREDTLRVMVGFMESHPDAGLAGCRIMNPDGTLQLACRRSFPTPWIALTKIVGLSTLFPRTRLFGQYNLTYLNPDETYEVDAVSGSFMMVRRAVVEAVGELDEQFFMYGEDLDWCYRIKRAGWKIYYVHETQIIHYKGESARRSNLDEVTLFYEAMRVFVRKHFRRGIFSDLILPAGIATREAFAFLGKSSKALGAALLDVILVDCSLLLGEYIWFGEFFKFPAYAYPVTATVPPLTIVATMYVLGIYTRRQLSIRHAAGSVILGYVILSALTFFFKQYGFSRMVVVISGAMNLVMLPGWRLAIRALMRSPAQRRGSLFGRRTLVVGTDRSGKELLRKLRARITDGYEVVGFIDTSHKHVGEHIEGVEILGSIDNIGKVIAKTKASEVIFSTDALSYANILDVIGRSGNRNVNFRLIPGSLEVIIGKTHIDELNDIPLVDIEYNIDRPAHRGVKRVFDVTAGAVLMALLYPVAMIRRRSDPSGWNLVRRLPDVLRGTMSLVGPPAAGSGDRGTSDETRLYLGKPGITGLVQLNFRDDLRPEEIETYNLYYAKNQSLLLDLEILLKSFIRGVTR